MTKRATRGPLAVLAFGIAALLGASAAAATLAETQLQPMGTVPASRQGGIALSADGRHVAYVLKNGEKFIVVVDGKESREYDDVRGLAMTPDGKHAACAAAREGAWVIVLDGKETERYGAVSVPAFSADGKHLAFNALSSGDHATAVVDATPRTKFNAVLDAPPVFSFDGRRVAYEARTSGISKRPSVRDPNRTPPPNEPPPAWITGDGREVDIKTGSAPRDNFMVVDDQKGERANDVRFPAFSPDGKRLAYAALFGNLWFIVLDDRKVSDFYEDVTPPVFAPDSKTAAFAGMNEKKWAVVGGPRKFDATWDAVHSLRFSPDGKRLAFAALVGNAWQIVCDNRRGPAVDEIGWIGFSMDSRHLGCAARRGAAWFIVCDGVEGPPHEAVYPPAGAAMQALDKLCYVAADRGMGRLVEVAWPPASDWTAGLK